MSVLNKAQVKTLILDTAARTRFKAFTRVSEEWYAYLEGQVQQIIERGVRSHPTVGVTLYPPVRRVKEEV